MHPTYRAASELCGTGNVARQRAIVQGRITDGNLFGDILQDLDTDMTAEILDVFDEVDSTLGATMAYIDEDIDMIISNDEGDHVKAEEQFKGQLAAELQQLKALYQQIRLGILFY